MLYLLEICSHMLFIQILQWLSVPFSNQGANSTEMRFLLGSQPNLGRSGTHSLYRVMAYSAWILSETRDTCQWLRQDSRLATKGVIWVEQLWHSCWELPFVWIVGYNDCMLDENLGGIMNMVVITKVDLVVSKSASALLPCGPKADILCSLIIGQQKSATCDAQDSQRDGCLGPKSSMVGIWERDSGNTCLHCPCHLQ
jgi:hypothetical protein